MRSSFFTATPDSRVGAQQLLGTGGMVRRARRCPTRTRCGPLYVFSLELGDVRLSQAFKACLGHMAKADLRVSGAVVEGLKPK